MSNIRRIAEFVGGEGEVGISFGPNSEVWYNLHGSRPTLPKKRKLGASLPMIVFTLRILVHANFSLICHAAKIMQRKLLETL